MLILIRIWAAVSVIHFALGGCFHTAQQGTEEGDSKHLSMKSISITELIYIEVLLPG